MLVPAPANVLRPPAFALSQLRCLTPPACASKTATRVADFDIRFVHSWRRRRQSRPSDALVRSPRPKPLQSTRVSTAVYHSRPPMRRDQQPSGAAGAPTLAARTGLHPSQSQSAYFIEPSRYYSASHAVRSSSTISMGVNSARLLGLRSASNAEPLANTVGSSSRSKSR